MPFNREAMRRRRTLLNISQNTLAIMAGVHPTTIAKIERGALPNGGGGLGIDVFQRICEALQMEHYELLIAPEGNRYQRVVEFAKNQHSPLAAPHLHDHSRTVQARGLRKITEHKVDVEQVVRADDFANGELPVVEIPAAPDLYAAGDDEDYDTDPSTE